MTPSFESDVKQEKSEKVSKKDKKKKEKRKEKSSSSKKKRIESSDSGSDSDHSNIPKVSIFDTLTIWSWYSDLIYGLLLI